MPNRYCRDELINVMIGMAQLPNLQVHDAPNGVVQQDAFAIQWLQDILDFWFHMVPFSATVKHQSITCTAHNEEIIMPSDFILDVRNGLEVQTIPGDSTSYKRKGRVPLQKFINRRLENQTTHDVKYPEFYCIVGDDDNITTQYQTMMITPTPSINTQCYLWYYSLPARLEANQKPKFPSDQVCLDYLRLRALEWAGLLDPGTANKYSLKIIADMKASGLMNEPEDDEIPMDEQVYQRRGWGSNRNNWMGRQ
jgi:hypothetical protein